MLLTDCGWNTSPAEANVSLQAVCNNNSNLTWKDIGEDEAHIVE